LMTSTLLPIATAFQSAVHAKTSHDRSEFQSLLRRALTERICHGGDDLWRGHVGIVVDQPDEVVSQDFIGMNRITGVAPDLLEPTRGVRRPSNATTGSFA